MKHLSNWYIYVYMDPRRKVELLIDGVGFYDEPFYVGMGMNGRMYDHLKHDVRAAGNSDKHGRIAEIQAEGLQPTIRAILTGLTEDEAREAETRFIKKIGRTKDGGPLLNIRTGGEGGDRSVKTEIPLTEEQNAFLNGMRSLFTKNEK